MGARGVVHLPSRSASYVTGDSSPILRLGEVMLEVVEGKVCNPCEILSSNVPYQLPYVLLDVVHGPEFKYR